MSNKQQMSEILKFTMTSGLWVNIGIVFAATWQKISQLKKSVHQLTRCLNCSSHFRNGWHYNQTDRTHKSPWLQFCSSWVHSLVNPFILATSAIWWVVPGLVGPVNTAQLTLLSYHSS